MFLRYSSTRKKAILRACGYSPTSSTGIPESSHRPSRVARGFALFPDSMLIIPALDIKDGHCVRLKQGKMSEATVFSEDPVAMAAKDGKVAVEGWSKMTGHDVVDLAKKFQDYGVEAIIYTDIGRDGMLTGVNVDATLKLARELRVPVIASGGLTSVEDIKALCKIESEGINGVITGRAIYQGTLDFKKAQAEADKLGRGKGKTQE